MARRVSRSVQAFAKGDFTRLAERFVAGGLAVSRPVPGILQLSTATRGPQPARVLLSAGIHGDETAPVELLALLLEQLADQPHALAVELMVVVGNPDAIAQGRRFIDADLNRLFGQASGDYKTAVEAPRADAIMRAVAAFFTDAITDKWHFDLHAAIRPSHYPAFAVVPRTPPQPRADALFGWLGTAGIEAAICNPPPAGTFSAYTAIHWDATSATLELGQAAALGDNDLRRFDAARIALDGLLRGDAVSGGPRPQLFAVTQELIRHSEAFRMSFGADTKNFTPLAPGTVIAEDGDIVYRVGPQTEYAVFPNPDVRVGLRAGLMVVRCG